VLRKSRDCALAGVGGGGGADLPDLGLLIILIGLFACVDVRLVLDSAVIIIKKKA